MNLIESNRYFFRVLKICPAPAGGQAAWNMKRLPAAKIGFIIFFFSFHFYNRTNLETRSVPPFDVRPTAERMYELRA